mmetsp:Transcript_22579/g.55909  ORF Transcript_22579/g.55909 Transcript_22579/m.55909 type:complete len:282 (-) Transcript_22579:232-1077(-)
MVATATTPGVRVKASSITKDSTAEEVPRGITVTAKGDAAAATPLTATWSRAAPQPRAGEYDPVRGPTPGTSPRLEKCTAVGVRPGRSIWRGCGSPVCAAVIPTSSSSRSSAVALAPTRGTPQRSTVATLKLTFDATAIVATPPVTLTPPGTKVLSSEGAPAGSQYAPVMSVASLPPSVAACSSPAPSSSAKRVSGVSCPDATPGGHCDAPSACAAVSAALVYTRTSSTAAVPRVGSLPPLASPVVVVAVRGTAARLAAAPVNVCVWTATPSTYATHVLPPL